MSRILRLLIPALLLLLLGGAIGSHLRRQATIPLAPEAVPATPAPVAVDLRKAALIVRHQGQTQIEVRAERVSVSRDLRYATFTGLARAVLYDGGRIALRLRATEVVLDRQSNDLRVRGPLEITSPEGYRLTAPLALWVAARQELVFPEGIEMEAAGSTIRAARLTVDLVARSLLLEGGVDLTFPLREGAP